MKIVKVNYILKLYPFMRKLIKPYSFKTNQLNFKILKINII